MAPRHVDTFLQQIRSGSQKRRRDSEAEAALDSLPKNTPVCKYDTPSQMEAAARSVDDGGYCVFLDVPESLIFDDRRKMGIKRTDYFCKPKILIAKMPTKPHELATGWLVPEITLKMLEMGMRFNTYLANFGTANIGHKEPDLALIPQNLPSGRTDKWPTLVVETGKSEGHKALDRDARWWVQASAGEVRVVITIKVSRTIITVRRYGQPGKTRAAIIQTITMARRGQKPIRITGGPLRIPFRELFLRDETRNQGDFIFTEAELEAWANYVWKYF
ncbi:hypothetical protein FQN52_009212 [Onygenales sp. PD_12]|nr:hypothetical protein FQN52_009212 [Onygenales sp. PD_12]